MGATEDAASRRPARPGGITSHRVGSSERKAPAAAPLKAAGLAGRYAAGAFLTSCPASYRSKHISVPEYAHAVEVTVRLFAGLRERAGFGNRRVELPEGARVEDVWGALGLGDVPNGLLYAVNREYAGLDRTLDDGDEVAFIPPVSGGAFRLSAAPLDPAAVVAEVADDRAGAIATFVGTVRYASRGRTVVHLEYEAFEGMAEQVMEQIADELRDRHDLCAIAIHHRTGRVGIGEASVAIAVSAPHRQDALAACKEAIDTLKERVPLWKKEVYEGGEEWIARGS